MTKLRSKTHRFHFSTSGLTAIGSLLTLVILSFVTMRVSASNPGPFYSNVTSIAAAPNGGIWVQVDQGFSSGLTRAIYGAPEFADVPDRGSIAAIPGREGYWVVSPQGRIYSRGDAPELCGGELSNCSGFPSNPHSGQYITAAAATPDGQGLWAVGYGGQLWTAGTAQPFGDVTKERGSALPSGIAATPSGRGYYILLDDGGVFSFGDAVFYGSTGGNKPGGHLATGLALSLTPSGAVNGYWMVFDDGGVFTFGDAPFLGSSGGNNGGSIVNGIAARYGGRSYAWVHQNGAVALSANLPRAVIASRQFGTVIGPLNASTEPGTTLQLSAANGGRAQEWELIPAPVDLATSEAPSPTAESVVQLVNVKSRLCADVTGPPATAAIIQWPCKGPAEGWFNQLWTMITFQDGSIQFRAFGPPTSAWALYGGADGGLYLSTPGGAGSAWNLVAVP
jgi:hypothetical protein